MFGPDNPRYVSEWDYFEAEREKDIRDFHDDGGLDPYEYELAMADIWTTDDLAPDEDQVMFTKLRQVEHHNWTGETIVEGRTATVSVVRIKNTAANDAPAYGAAVGYKSCQLYMVFDQYGVYYTVGISETTDKHVELFEVDTEILLTSEANQILARGIDSPEVAGELVKCIVPGLVYALERHVPEAWRLAYGQY